MTLTAAPGLRLEVDGEWYDPKDLAWIQWAPCGCLCSVMTVRDRFTPEAAFDDLHESESKEMRERTKALGYRMQLVTFEHYKTLPFGPECPHSPQWGWPEEPAPEGMEWRVDGGMWAKKSARNHLFAPAPEGVKFWRDPIVSLCGRQKDHGGFKDYRRRDHLDCAACTKTAEQARLSAEPKEN